MKVLSVILTFLPRRPWKRLWRRRRTKVTSTDEPGRILICQTNPVNISRNSRHSRRTIVIYPNVSVWPIIVGKISLFPSIFWIIVLFAFPATVRYHSVTEHAKESTVQPWYVVNGHSNDFRFA